MSNTPKSTSDADLWDSFTQYAQRCPICYDWLMGDTELIADPKHKYQVVHKSCVYIFSVDDEPPVEPQPARRSSRIELSSATKRNLEKKKNFVKTNVLSI